MIIDPNTRIVFLANAKVASTSLEHALLSMPHKESLGQINGMPRLKHITYSTFLKLRPTLGLQHFRTVGVIRHPAGKLESWYKYRSRDALKGKPRYTGDMSFAEFIKTAPEPEIDDRHFACDPGTGTMVDMLFKYEVLHELTAWLRTVYGPQFDLPRKNVSPQISVPEHTALITERFGAAIQWYEMLPDVPDRL